MILSEILEPKVNLINRKINRHWITLAQVFLKVKLDDSFMYELIRIESDKYEVSRNLAMTITK